MWVKGKTGCEGEEEGDPVDGKSALRQINFREKCELSLHMFSQWKHRARWSYSPRFQGLLVAAAGLSTEKDTLTAAQTGARAEQGRAQHSIYFPRSAGTRRDWSWEGGWATPSEQPTPKYILPIFPSPQPHCSMRIPLRNTAQTMDDYSPLWQRHSYSTE